MLRAYAEGATGGLRRHALSVAVQEGRGPDTQQRQGVPVQAVLLADKHQLSCQQASFGPLCMPLVAWQPLCLVLLAYRYHHPAASAGGASPQWERVRTLSSPDWQAPVWIAATCLRMMAEQCDGDWPAAPGEVRLLMGLFAATAAAIPDSEGHAALLNLALRVLAP